MHTLLPVPPRQMTDGTLMKQANLPQTVKQGTPVQEGVTIHVSGGRWPRRAFGAWTSQNKTSMGPHMYMCEHPSINNLPNGMEDLPRQCATFPDSPNKQ